MLNSKKHITDVQQLLSYLDRENKKIVFTNGCFDLLHQGHLHLLKEVKKLGDKLIVAINSNASVRKLKGETRPIETLEIRIEKLIALDDVDYVISFSDDTPLLLIEQIQPDVLVKGGDYKIDEIIGRQFAKNITIIPLLSGFSTTKIIGERK